MAFSFIQPYIPFLTWVGGLPLCALYLLIGSMSIVGMVSFFVCSFLHHCLFLFVSILHLHTVYLLVQFLSSLFTSLLFYLVWWWCALVPELPVRFVTPFVPPVGFDPRFLGWRGQSRLEVWGSFCWIVIVWNSAQKKNEKKEKLCLFGIRWYTWDHQRWFWVWEISFSFKSWMRALYDPSHHGSGRHIGSEVWVSLALGPWIIVYITIPII